MKYREGELKGIENAATNTGVRKEQRAGEGNEVIISGENEIRKKMANIMDITKYVKDHNSRKIVCIKIKVERKNIKGKE